MGMVPVLVVPSAHSTRQPWPDGPMRGPVKGEFNQGGPCTATGRKKGVDSSHRRPAAKSRWSDWQTTSRPGWASGAPRDRAQPPGAAGRRCTPRGGGAPGTTVGRVRGAQDRVIPMYGAQVLVIRAAWMRGECRGSVFVHGPPLCPVRRTVYEYGGQRTETLLDLLGDDSWGRGLDPARQGSV